MSKSLKRVERDAADRGLDIEIRALGTDTTTAQMAADALGCDVAQIVKSIVFRVEGSDRHVLFLTSGRNRVDPAKAAGVAGVALEKADAASIRAFTGFAIGGVSPIGHLNEIETFFDPDILTFDVIWAAAGTPQHVFRVLPRNLHRKTGATLADFTD